MNTYHYILIYCAALFVIGLTYGHVKGQAFVKAIGKERAKELGISSMLSTFLKNPFTFPYSVVLGAFEVFRIVATVVGQMLINILQFLGSIRVILFKDHMSTDMCYSYVMSWHSLLSKQDLEKVALFYDVPMNHLLQITREPTTKTVSSLAKQRQSLSMLSGNQIDELLKIGSSVDIKQWTNLDDAVTLAKNTEKSSDKTD
jgi:hypothetical protein